PPSLHNRDLVSILVAAKCSVWCPPVYPRTFFAQISFAWTITAMLQSRAISPSRTCVNIVKKVNVNGQWKFRPVVVESTGRPKDRVRINGRNEVYPEGVYYIEWGDNGRGRHQAIPNRHEGYGTGQAEGTGT